MSMRAKRKTKTNGDACRFAWKDAPRGDSSFKLQCSNRNTPHVRGGACVRAAADWRARGAQLEVEFGLIVSCVAFELALSRELTYTRR